MDVEPLGTPTCVSAPLTRLLLLSSSFRTVDAGFKQKTSANPGSKENLTIFQMRALPIIATPGSFAAAYCIPSSLPVPAHHTGDDIRIPIGTQCLSLSEPKHLAP
jgi:hypothetical protein